MSVFYNRTRQSKSIPRKLLRERKPYLIPVYYVLLTSELASEGIHHSGSYRFADRIYANIPKGRFVTGRLLDRVLLGLPSARAFRWRYLTAKQEIRRLEQETAATGAPLDVLAVPSGYARELFEVADELRSTGDPAVARMRWHGLDLDERLVGELRARALDAGHLMQFSVGDVFSDNALSRCYDLVISMGFTEFLDDEQTVRFYRIIRERLRPSGRMVTSGMRPHRLSDYLLRNIGELHTHYRSEAQLRHLCQRAGFASIRSSTDPTGLQTMIVATKE